MRTKVEKWNIRMLKMTVWERDRYSCYYCGLNMKESYFLWRNKQIRRKDCPLTVDHIIPKSKGGLWNESNLVTCCRGCNLEKGSNIVSVPLLRARIATHKFVDKLFAIVTYIVHNYIIGR